MATTHGTPVKDSVVKQIAARKAVISKQTGRTREDLLYLNGKTGWIKLSSSVNTLTDEETASIIQGVDPRNVLGSNKHANQNVLLGGVLNPNKSLRQGIDTTGADNPNAAYNNRKDSTGIRPMPGITSMNVKSKNTYGTLREATVTFSVWTLEDFERMEELYLRPGFSVLLEWGHSLYLNNEGVLYKDTEAIGSQYFNNGITMSQILKDIVVLRDKSCNNYEAMIGYIQNFSWNYTATGGYECSVNIISTGEILESLQIRFDPANRVDTKFFANKDSDAGKEQRKSILHYIFQKMTYITDATFGKAALQQYAGDLVKDLQEFTGFFLETQLDGWWDEDVPMHWISLRTFFDIFNTTISPVDTTKPIGTPDSVLARFNTDYAHSTTFLTSGEHFSIDPTVCVLPIFATIDQGRTLKVTPIHTTGAVVQGDGFDDVLNILISIPFIKSVLDGALDKDGKLSKSMHDITESILEGINTALGGINDLGLAFDEELEGGTWHVVDRNNTLSSTVAIPEFTLAGIDSVFTEVSISSKISNEIGSQISIAAQSSAENTQDNIENLLKWNPNVVDRLKVIKSVTPKPDQSKPTIEKETEDKIGPWLTDVSEFFYEFSDSSGYKKADMEALKTLHAEWTVNNVVKKAKTQKKEAIPGLVPVELSFKLDGIGGLIIAQAFKITSGILPSKYQDKFGYIITGLEHAIGLNNRWETSVTTQFYAIAPPSDAEVAAAGSAPAIAGLNPALQNNGSIPNSGVSTSKGGATRVIDGVTYKNGQLPPDKLVSIANQAKYKGAISSDGGQIRLYPKAATALNKLLAAATAGKVNLKINSAYRTVADQKKTFEGNCSNSADSMQRCIPKPGEGPAAIPGKSNHGFGLAIDFANSNKKKMNTSMPEYAWLVFNAAQYGFKRIASEAWHWEYQT
jgi:hypothetical protein